MVVEMRTYKIYHLIIFLFLLGCNSKEVDSIFRMTLCDTPNVIYQINYRSNFPTNDGYSELVLMDSTEDILNPNTYYKLIGRPVRIDSENNLSTINYTLSDRNNSTSPVSTNIEGFDIKLIQKTFEHGQQMHGEYLFNEIKDNISTITFLGIKTEFGPIVNDTITVNKGGIWMYDKNGIIESLSFTQVIDSLNLPLNLTFHPKSQINVSRLSDCGIFKRIK